MWEEGLRILGLLGGELGELQKHQVACVSSESRGFALIVTRPSTKPDEPATIPPRHPRKSAWSPNAVSDSGRQQTVLYPLSRTTQKCGGAPEMNLLPS